MRKAPALWLAVLLTGAFAAGLTTACGSSNSSNPTDAGEEMEFTDGPVTTDGPILTDGPNSSDSPSNSDAPSNNDGGKGDAGCVDDAGGFVCCVLNMVNNETTSSGTPDPNFCNMGGTNSPTAFSSLF